MKCPNCDGKMYFTKVTCNHEIDAECVECGYYETRKVSQEEAERVEELLGL